MLSKYKFLPAYAAIGLIIFTLFVAMAHYWGGVIGVKYGSWRYRLEMLPPIKQSPDNYQKPNQYDIAMEIIKQSRQSNFNPSISLKIAICESNLNHLATSNKSSAKGVYQFIDKTWSNYCNGDVYNYKDNIACFIKLYEKYPEWWNCQ